MTLVYAMLTATVLIGLYGHFAKWYEKGDK